VSTVSHTCGRAHGEWHGTETIRVNRAPATICEAIGTAKSASWRVAASKWFLAALLYIVADALWRR